MSETEIELGPIDYIVVEWPADRQPNGEAFPHLIDLVDRGLIRILDFAVITVGSDGSVAGLDLNTLDESLTVFDGASSGLLSDEDYADAAGVLEPGSTAALLVYENTWAAPFATALRKNGARLVANGRIPINEIIAALDEVEAATA
ncbi:MAG TPA: DUF6325 family protein [Gaiellaceae bacterium]|jgi:hypothetical protein|nr:DUF6325 family protein [Gaiellaceae bacterium]